MNTSNKNSFGLGIFPKGNTPVKVAIKDWGCCVDREDREDGEDGKARVLGLTVL